MLTEPIRVTLEVVDVLDNMNIDYFIGGSMASAVHGIARATLDVDLVVDMQIDQVETLSQNLETDFYVDSDLIRNAITNGLSFNIIHKESFFKVDFFIKKDRPFDKSQFDRRATLALTSNPKRYANISSPEDNILAKLEWYRLGGEHSDRQWRDILNVIKIQGQNLELDYLRKWAAQLRILDLLENALVDTN